VSVDVVEELLVVLYPSLEPKISRILLALVLLDGLEDKHIFLGPLSRALLVFRASIF